MIYCILYLAFLTAVVLINYQYHKKMKHQLTQEKKDIIIDLIADSARCMPDHLEEEIRFKEDLSMDSLEIIELFMNIEREFNIHIPDSDLEGCKTIEQLFNVVSKNL